ncbi:hypothetical protein Tco_0775324 [Tanacetum coccineum]
MAFISTQIHDYRLDPEIIHLEQVRGNPTCQFKQRDSLSQIMKCVCSSLTDETLSVQKTLKVWETIDKQFGKMIIKIKWRSIRLTPPVPVPTVEKADEMILQDTLQVSLAEHKSLEEQEARENVELVNKHLASEEIEKLVEGSENVIDDSSPPRNNETQILGTGLEPWSDKESPEVERTNDEEVEVTNVVIPVNINEEEDEITNEVYELKRREKGKIVEESRSTPLPTPIRSPRTHTNPASSDTEKLQELTETHTQTTSSSRLQHTKLSRANRPLSLFKAKPTRFK